MKPLLITGAGSISSLGASRNAVRASYNEAKDLRSIFGEDADRAPMFALSDETEAFFHDWLLQNKIERSLDRVTKLALFASYQARQSAQWSDGLLSESAISVGSARGATDTFESIYRSFLGGNRPPSSTSPTTTLGGISSSVGSFLGSASLTTGTSMTCASFFQSLLIGAALIESGRVPAALVCGAEAPLTGFTIAQMQALRIYSQELGSYPCRPLNGAATTRNTMVLGEGAAAFTIESSSFDRPDRSVLGTIRGIGFARENNATPTAMKGEGEGLQLSMTRAFKDAGIDSVDAIVVHAPGTKQGDRAELAAIDTLFPKKRPALFSTKYLTGHTLGAAGALSLELALLVLNEQLQPYIPFETSLTPSQGDPIRTICLNAAGFGGVVVSVVVASNE